jgi:hypothetical protein
VPDDLPYRAAEFAARDVTAQDWATFVNFLIPDHGARGNDAIIDRKLRAEDAGDARSQLEGLRERERSDESLMAAAAEQRRDVEATVRQWNDEFFLPRGITIRLLPAPAERMPGSWDSAFDKAASAPEVVPSSSSSSPHAERSGSRGNLFGGFKMDEDGIRIGDSFIMDSNQMRIGNLILDSNGIRMGGPGSNPRGLGTQQARQARGPAHPYPHPYPHSYVAGPAPGPPNPDHRQDERGRQPQTSGVTQSRDSSPSLSSNSHSESSSSDSSIGSLPDYDQVRDEQLPLYTERLRVWLARPDEVRTKADVRQLRADLRAPPSAVGQAGAGTQSPAEARRQLKALNAQWKQLKKEQRRARRQMHRERKQRRRSEKRERRQRRRDIKRAERELRRDRAHPSVSPVPPTPCFAVPPIYPTPPVPSGAPIPAVPPVPMPSSWGAPRHCHPRRGGLPGRAPPQPFCATAGPFGPFGRHCGPFGRGRGSIFNSSHATPRGLGDPRQAPGAWPGAADDAAPPPPGPASAQMYRTVGELETQIMSKQATLAGVGDTTTRMAVEAEVEALARSLDAIRMSADEAYARELAAQ